MFLTCRLYSIFKEIFYGNQCSEHPVEFVGQDDSALRSVENRRPLNGAPRAPRPTKGHRENSGQNKNASPLRKFRGETVTSHGSTLLTALAVARVLCNGRARSGLLPQGGSADSSGVVSPPCRAGYSQPRYPSLPAAPQFCLHQRFSVGYYSTKTPPCQALSRTSKNGQ